MSQTPQPPQTRLRRFDGTTTSEGSGEPVHASPSEVATSPVRPAVSSPPREESWGKAIFTSPWLWGGLLTLGFYQAVPHLPVWREEAIRYFCSHPIEYAEVTLFFIGMTIVVFKAVALFREKKAYATVSGLAPLSLHEEATVEQQLMVLDQQLSAVPAPVRTTYWYRRLDQLRTFFKSRRTDGLDEHLTFLSSSAEAQLYESHALLQMVIWAIPILGFLGTVMGITLAIANITPEQLDTSLNSVTGGLSVAFDTTALGLAQSLILGFASLFVRRSEERLLGLIDERIRVEVHQFLPVETQTSPWADAEAIAARQLIEKTGSLIESQTDLWRDSIEEFRNRWTQTLDLQREKLSGQLSAGTEATLSDHAQQLHGFRQEFTAAYQEVTRQLREEMSRMEAGAQDREERFAEVLNRFNADFHLRLQAMWDSRERDEVFRNNMMQTQLAAWQNQMASLTQTSQELLKALTSQSETLLKIYEHEENLSAMQSRLTQNLEALRATGSFEDAVHQMTGAVHLLTARARRDAA